jgi:hypothetical protein
MKKPYKAYYLIIFALLCCRKPYNPPAIASPGSYLVVEGVIDSGNDSTFIKLSKTVNLNGKSTVNPVLGASVIVESDQNNSFPLLDVNGNGNYSSAPLNLPATQKYRLKINTSDGKQYLSDFIAVTPTPPIDSIGYVMQNGAAQLYLNTHDPANNTHYYRWEYTETWIFHSKYQSYWVLDPNTNTIIHRTDNQAIYNCFGNDTSSFILLGSTTKLKQDVIYQTPLIKIPITSEKFEVKYSILVKQYALTSGAYEFYQNLQKNTQQLGSIFDAQPTQLNGNIHNVKDANEPVIGFLTVTNVQSKRIFLLNNIIPPFTQPIYPFDCEQNEAFYSNKQGYNDVQNILINPPLTDLPTYAIFATSPTGIIGFGYSTPICVDCTLRGTTKIPTFWK